MSKRTTRELGKSDYFVANPQLSQQSQLFFCKACALLHEKDVRLRSADHREGSEKQVQALSRNATSNMQQKTPSKEALFHLGGCWANWTELSCDAKWRMDQFIVVEQPQVRDLLPYVLGIVENNCDTLKASQNTPGEGDAVRRPLRASKERLQSV